MSLVDQTNYEIRLEHHVGDLEGYGFLHVDAEQDSSFNPPEWVYIHLNDDEHDCEQIKLTYDEAGLLHDRLGLILGRPAAAPTAKLCKGCDGHPHAVDGEDPCPGYTCPDCMGSGEYTGSLSEFYELAEHIQELIGSDDKQRQGAEALAGHLLEKGWKQA